LKVGGAKDTIAREKFQTTPTSVKPRPFLNDATATRFSPQKNER